MTCHLKELRRLPKKSTMVAKRETRIGALDARCMSIEGALSPAWHPDMQVRLGTELATTMGRILIMTT